MLSYAETPTPRVLPISALLATLVASLGFSYWLVPDQKEMVERLMMDQQYGRIAEVLRSLGEDGSDLALHEINAEQLNQLTGLMRLTPREQINIIFSPTRSLAYNRYLHTLVLAAVRYVDVIAPDKAWDIIAPQLDRLSPAQAEDLATLLSRNAMSLSQPKLAARILQRATELPGSRAETAKQMALAHRWSAQPAVGARSLRRWLEQHHGIAEFSELSNLCASLALEGGKPSLALDVSLEEMETLGADGVPTPQQLERTLSYALQSTRTVDLIPWLQRYVGAQPETAMSLATLKQQVAAKSSHLADYRRWATLLAQYSDWNSRFDAGFDVHLRLAVVGERPSLDRCLQLYDFLGRSEEMAELLEVIGPVENHPNLLIQHATLLAGLGRDRDARPIYEQWLKQHPEDRNAAFDYASLLQDMGNEDEALNAFESVNKHHPDDVPAIKKLAEHYIRAERYADALKLYTTLKAEDHDHYTLENYAMLAESLDQHDQLLTAQILAAQQLRNVEAYLDIADSAGYLKDHEAALKELGEGLKLYANSAALRIAIGSLHLKDEAFDRAFGVLMHPSTRQHPSAVALLLRHATDFIQQPQLLAFLGQDVEATLSLSAQNRLDLAVLCHACGEVARGEKLFASVPVKPTNFAMLAEARFNMGAVEDAAVFLSQHLNDNPRAKADEWVFLGDIYELMGRDEDAKRAYNYSLNLLTADLPDTASVAPQP
jgi:tetratricopeptide (TPR) repeat protein